MVQLRPFQATAVDDIRNAFMAGYRRVLFVLPTGGGKTYTFVYIAERAAARGNRVWILVHRQELVQQASDSLHELGCRHSIIASGYRMDLHQRVQVVSIDSLARRLDSIPLELLSDILIVDEAHHGVAGKWAKVLAYLRRSLILGVTATPARLDGRGLREQFDILIEGPDAAWLTQEKFLANIRVFNPPGLDLSGIRRTDRGKGKQEAEGRMRTRQAMGDVVGHYRRTIEPVFMGTAIAFCHSVPHAEAVVETFRAAGIAAAAIDGKTDKRLRKQLIDDLGSGKLKVLANYDIISEGTDIPTVTGGIDLNPTESLARHLQKIGRVARPADGKPFAVWNDHVGGTFNGDDRKHGLLTDPREWTLDGLVRGKRSKSSEAIPLRVCPACFCTVPSACNPCSECGHVVGVVRRELKMVAGELQELGQQQAAIEARQTKRREVAQARTREELEAIARREGYKPGWVNHILAARGQHHARRAVG